MKGRGGSGLSVMTASNIVGQHNGRLEISTRRGKRGHGSTFTLNLPLKQHKK